ncbi:MAG: KamA family radical SAM protein [Alphaproteobacteria bacterium]|nr:KamA family radical SAM protein [Alphaproteobacteria bacterium]
MTQADLFRKAFFPHVSTAEWRDWRWQLANRLTTAEQISRILTLTKDEQNALQQANVFPTAITPYYASLLERSPLRKTMLPSTMEKTLSVGETDDPLGEEPCMVATGLVHRYPDRVLFLTTEYCSAYCRYCTRSRLVGRHAANCSGNGLKQRWRAAFEYIRAHKEVRDVLVSGGDPLTMSDELLDYLLASLRAIKHVEMIRIGSKVPAVLPMRITPALMKVIRRHHPVYFSLHFTHPDEMTPETVRACERIANAGIPSGSQTVLLQGINDDAETLKGLMHALLKARVRPYYLFQCDPIAGSMHFRVPVAKGIELINALRGHTSGYAVPTYAIDIPGGGGKIIINDQRCVGRDGDFLLLKNFENNIYRYPDPLTDQK